MAIAKAKNSIGDHYAYIPTVFIELRYYSALAPNASSFLNSLHYLENFCVIDSSIQILHKCKAFQETILRHFWTSHRRLEVGLRDRNPDQKDFRMSFSDNEKVCRGVCFC